MEVEVDVEAGTEEEEGFLNDWREEVRGEGLGGAGEEDPEGVGERRIEAAVGEEAEMYDEEEVETRDFGGGVGG